MLDFNSLTVKCGQGLGRVVKESSTIKIEVSVLHFRRDMGGVYLLKMTREVNGTDQLELEVIEI